MLANITVHSKAARKSIEMATSTVRLKVTQGKDVLNQHKLHFYHPDYALTVGIKKI